MTERFKRCRARVGLHTLLPLEAAFGAEEQRSKVTFRMFLPGPSEEAISPTVAAQRPEKQPLLCQDPEKGLGYLF